LFFVLKLKKEEKKKKNLFSHPNLPTIFVVGGFFFLLLQKEKYREKERFVLK